MPSLGPHFRGVNCWVIFLTFTHYIVSQKAIWNQREYISYIFCPMHRGAYWWIRGGFVLFSVLQAYWVSLGLSCLGILIFFIFRYFPCQVAYLSKVQELNTEVVSCTHLRFKSKGYKEICTRQAVILLYFCSKSWNSDSTKILFLNTFCKCNL